MVVSRDTPYGEHNFRNIVAATDFSEQSDCAVNYGGQMARQYKASLYVFHCLDSEGMGGTYTQEEIEAEVDRREKRLEEEYEDRVKGIGKCTFECWEGKPSMEILKAARIHEADLIIMAHHSKETDPEKAFLGSTVTQVALNSACPTMSVNRHFDLRCGLMYDQSGGVDEETAEAAG
jgi:nucleotide-binding universal stress UspA family protein